MAAAVPFGSPAYQAGLERDDVILQVAGLDVTRAADFGRAIGGRQPGDQVPLVFERRGQLVTSMLHLAENPQVEIVRVEDVGRTLTQEQRRFRDAWLRSPAERVLNTPVR